MFRLRFECSNCKSQNNCIHDTKERIWRHLNFFQFKAYIHARVPRTICQKCGSIRLMFPGRGGVPDSHC
ncbi:MAG: transposase family protein [Methanothrix sp.]